jgi:hypothetical protein
MASLAHADPDANLDAHHAHAVPTQSDPHTHAVPAQPDPHAYVVPTQPDPHAHVVPAQPYFHSHASSLDTDARADRHTPADEHAGPAYANVGQAAPAQPGLSPGRATRRGM